MTLALLIAGSASAEPAGPAEPATPAPATGKARSFRERLDKPDRTLEFNIDQMSPSSRRPGTFQAKTSPASKSFYIVDKTRLKSFQTRDFGTKSAWSGDFKFSTAEANTKGKYVIPNAETKARVKTAPTKNAREAGKTAATRQLPDANRPYLGPESKRMNRGLSQEDLDRIARFERKADLMKLETIEDIRTLLNKN
ncbi:MAG: hypothetical protein ABI680_03855 [Chthoniobacteraceae bacterium]